MLGVKPKWFSGRSWEFWRERLSFFFSTYRRIREETPRRSFDARVFRPQDLNKFLDRLLVRLVMKNDANCLQ
jgi:hypothetical protein